jgi:hypothetical protein
MEEALPHDPASRGKKRRATLDVNELRDSGQSWPDKVTSIRVTEYGKPAGLFVKMPPSAKKKKDNLQKEDATINANVRDFVDLITKSISEENDSSGVSDMLRRLAKAVLKKVPADTKEMLSVLLGMGVSENKLTLLRQAAGSYAGVFPTSGEFRERQRASTAMLEWGVYYPVGGSKKAFFVRVRDVKQYLLAVLEKMFQEEGLGEVNGFVNAVLNMDQGGTGRTKCSKLTLTLVCVHRPNSRNRVIPLGFCTAEEKHQHIGPMYGPLLRGLNELLNTPLSFKANPSSDAEEPMHKVQVRRDPPTPTKQEILQMLESARLRCNHRGETGTTPREDTIDPLIDHYSSFEERCAMKHCVDSGWQTLSGVCSKCNTTGMNSVPVYEYWHDPKLDCVFKLRLTCATDMKALLELLGLTLNGTHPCELGTGRTPDIQKGKCPPNRDHERDFKEGAYGQRNPSLLPLCILLTVNIMHVIINTCRVLVTMSQNVWGEAEDRHGQHTNYFAKAKPKNRIHYGERYAMFLQMCAVVSVQKQPYYSGIMLGNDIKKLISNPVLLVAMASLTTAEDVIATATATATATVTATATEIQPAPSSSSSSSSSTTTTSAATSATSDATSATSAAATAAAAAATADAAAAAAAEESAQHAADLCDAKFMLDVWLLFAKLHYLCTVSRRLCWHEVWDIYRYSTILGKIFRDYAQFKPPRGYTSRNGRRVRMINSISPSFHKLLDHISQHAFKWGWVGLVNEQGPESFHTLVNTIMKSMYGWYAEDQALYYTFRHILSQASAPDEVPK